MAAYTNYVYARYIYYRYWNASNKIHQLNEVHEFAVQKEKHTQIE